MRENAYRGCMKIGLAMTALLLLVVIAVILPTSSIGLELERSNWYWEENANMWLPLCWSSELAVEEQVRSCGICSLHGGKDTSTRALPCLLARSKVLQHQASLAMILTYDPPRMASRQIAFGLFRLSRCACPVETFNDFDHPSLTMHTCSGMCMRLFSGTDDRAFTQRTGRELYYTRQEFLHVAATFPLDSRATVEVLLVRYSCSCISANLPRLFT